MSRQTRVEIGGWELEGGKVPGRDATILKDNLLNYVEVPNAGL
jgi:hypothetical protein